MQPIMIMPLTSGLPGHVAGELGWPWKAARVMRLVPKAIRDVAYDVVARTRYRVFGRYDRCLIPRPEFRSRFIDSSGGHL